MPAIVPILWFKTDRFAPPLSTSAGRANEEYLGVIFTAWPDGYVNGVSGEFEMELWYYPRVDYTKLIPGATFTIREGGRIVGHGIIRTRVLN